MSASEDYGIVAELLDSGSRLWSSVQCDVKQNCIVVYARLYGDSLLDVDGALVESERLLKSVIERRLGGRKSWVAAVHWSDRLCKTFTPPADDFALMFCETGL
jgi:hypothetical protein